MPHKITSDYGKSSMVDIKYKIMASEFLLITTNVVGNYLIEWGDIKEDI